MYINILTARGADIFIEINDDVILVLPLKTNIQFNFDLAGTYKDDFKPAGIIHH